MGNSRDEEVAGAAAGDILSLFVFATEEESKDDDRYNKPPVLAGGFRIRCLEVVDRMFCCYPKINPRLLVLQVSSLILSLENTKIRRSLIVILL